MNAFSEAWLADYQARQSGVGGAAQVEPVASIVPETLSISLELPTPPSVNRMFANVPGVGRVKTDGYRKWLKKAVAAAVPVLGGRAAIKGAFKATIHVAAAGDLDNRVKAVLDLCQLVGMIEEDKHLVELHVYRQSGKEGLWVTLEKMPDIPLNARTA